MAGLRTLAAVHGVRGEWTGAVENPVEHARRLRPAVEHDADGGGEVAGHRGGKSRDRLDAPGGRTNNDEASNAHDVLSGCDSVMTMLRLQTTVLYWWAAAR